MGKSQWNRQNYFQIEVELFWAYGVCFLPRPRGTRGEGAPAGAFLPSC